MIIIDATDDQINAIKKEVSKLKECLTKAIEENDGWLTISLEDNIEQFEKIIETRKIKLQTQTY